MKTTITVFLFLLAISANAKTGNSHKHFMKDRNHFIPTASISFFGNDTLHIDSTDNNRHGLARGSGFQQIFFSYTVIALSEVNPGAVYREVNYAEGKIPGAGRRRAGKILTFGGLGLLSSGIVFLSVANEEPGLDLMRFIGSVFRVYGIAATVTGVILWRSGQKKYNRHLAGTTSVGVTQNGLSLRLHLN